MRVDPAHARVERADVVGASRHRGAEPWDERRELRQIGAEVAEDVDFEREKPARLVHRHLGDRHIVPALRVADEMLAAVGAPDDRTAESLRGLEHKRIFAVDEGLRAEAAADVASHDAQLLLGHS